MNNSTVKTTNNLTCPIVVLDLETSGSGRNYKLNRILAIGAVVLDPARFADNVDEFKIMTQERLSKLIPKEDQFRIYIHDQDALEQIKDCNNPGPIWQEVQGREFWLSKNESN